MKVGRHGLVLQLQIQTSSSEMIPVSDFHYIYDMARCSKCQTFIVLRETNSLYGFIDDCCSIHQMYIPFPVNTDLVFGIDIYLKEIVNRFSSYFIPSKFDWVLLPDYYWEMYAGDDLYSEYDAYQEHYIIKDKTTKQPIEQIHMYKAIPNNDMMLHHMTTQLDGFLNRCKTLLPPITFSSLKDNPIIRNVYDNKASMGRNLLHLKNDQADVALYIYKSLFTLNKADDLDIDIRFDSYERSTFMATFKPKRKKNPMILNTYGVPFSEVIHCMYLNII